MIDLSDKKLIYIAGYGRSGSTMLCAVLGATDNAIGVGEFRRLFNSYRQKRICACGCVIGECELWGAVLQRFFQENPSVSSDYAEAVTKRCERANLGSWGKKIQEADLLDYQKIWSSLIEITCDVAKVDVLVDSSKSSLVSADRARLLSEFIAVSQVFLVRDPRAVALSALNMQRKRIANATTKPNIFRVPQSLLGWFFANAYFLMVTRKNASITSIVVRYEDVTQRAEDVLSQIQARFSWRLEPVSAAISKGEALSAGHLFSGDGQRKGNGYLIAPMKEKWRQDLPGVYKAMAFTVYPMARIFGYMNKASSQRR